jgi:enoyl-CoA hydratase/carnithine racemase
MTHPVLLIEHPERHIVHATINRPHVLNAIDFDVMTALEALLADLEDTTTRVLVLRGAGDRSFISGGDLKTFAPLKTHDDAVAMSQRMGDILARLERASFWVVAHVNGDAYGGGCETMAACDFRWTHAQARLGWTQARFALPPGWGGLTRLVEIIGRPAALSWLAQASVLSADDAAQVGFVDHVSEDANALVAEVAALAQRLARQPRALIHALKQGSMPAGRAELMLAEREPFAQAWASDEHHARVQRFLAR